MFHPHSCKRGSGMSCRLDSLHCDTVVRGSPRTLLCFQAVSYIPKSYLQAETVNRGCILFGGMTFSCLLSPHKELSTSSFVLGLHAVAKTCKVLMYVPSAFLQAGLRHFLHVGQSALLHGGERHSLHFGVLPGRFIFSPKASPGRRGEHNFHPIALRDRHF